MLARTELCFMLARTELQEEVTSQAPVFASSPKSVEVKEGFTTRVSDPDSDEEGKIFIVHPFNWAALWVSPPNND
jgi:hypothetical protein